MELKKTAAEKWLDRVLEDDSDVTVKLQTKRLQDALVEVAATELSVDFKDLPADVQALVPAARDALQGLVAGIYEFKQNSQKAKKPEVKADVREDKAPASEAEVIEIENQFGAMSVKELRKEAQGVGVTGTSKMTKAQLLEAIATAIAA